MNWRKTGLLYVAVLVGALCLGLGSFVVFGGLGGDAGTVQTVEVTTSSPSNPAMVATSVTPLPSVGSASPEASSSSTSPSQTTAGTGSTMLSLPDPNYMAVDTGATTQTIFGHGVPIPAKWSGAMGGEGIRIFADMTTCNDVVGNCPHIMFIDLSDNVQREQYGHGSSSPLDWLSQTSCADGSQKQAIQGPSTDEIDGNAVLYYVQGCGIPDPNAYNDNIVWYFPDLHFMVAAAEGVNGSLDPTTIQAVLKRTTW